MTNQTITFGDRDRSIPSFQTEKQQQQESFLESPNCISTFKSLSETESVLQTLEIVNINYLLNKHLLFSF